MQSQPTPSKSLVQSLCSSAQSSQPSQRARFPLVTPRKALRECPYARKFTSPTHTPSPLSKQSIVPVDLEVLELDEAADRIRKFEFQMVRPIEGSGRCSPFNSGNGSAVSVEEAPVASKPLAPLSHVYVPPQPTCLCLRQAVPPRPTVGTSRSSKKKGRRDLRFHALRISYFGVKKGDPKSKPKPKPKAKPQIRKFESGLLKRNPKLTSGETYNALVGMQKLRAKLVHQHGRRKKLMMTTYTPAEWRMWVEGARNSTENASKRNETNATENPVPAASEITSNVVAEIVVASMDEIQKCSNEVTQISESSNTDAIEPSEPSVVRECENACGDDTLESSSDTTSTMSDDDLDSLAYEVEASLECNDECDMADAECRGKEIAVISGEGKSATEPAAGESVEAPMWYDSGDLEEGQIIEEVPMFFPPPVSDGEAEKITHSGAQDMFFFLPPLPMFGSVRTLYHVEVSEPKSLLEDDTASCEGTRMLRRKGKAT
ncbi:hypothetical protein M427DRAFT_52315 [Gonapodya prolifera JEL478]|uniref:Uncharacterized protein n=1 Tax=Gonapodya prolifera (strain JEL478) TaxID=1344416 RepID=A0A139ATK4_GONPJ|nr:hypothetical protein M427DRAFT_52315 [Gonapodya prolifera JEL478]|eukprot:KXS20049.1 hypothetical protein M427DRAFT_52315 [Gonapodya prolifera JEL478]